MNCKNPLFAGHDEGGVAWAPAKPTCCSGTSGCQAKLTVLLRDRLGNNAFLTTGVFEAFRGHPGCQVSRRASSWERNQR